MKGGKQSETHSADTFEYDQSLKTINIVGVKHCHGATLLQGWMMR